MPLSIKNNALKQHFSEQSFSFSFFFSEKHNYIHTEVPSR